jgi:hypothetical protein
MFKIELTDKPLEYPFDDPIIPAAPGELTLGKHTEEFLANMSLWDRSAYESHWLSELRALCEGNPKVALIVSYDDPKASSNLEIWRAYLDGQWVHFQNQLLWYGDIPAGFEISKISQYIPDRAIMNAEGERYSEWDVDIRDIELFLRRSNGP